jgi:hypothetical protein
MRLPERLSLDSRAPAGTVTVSAGSADLRLVVGFHGDRLRRDVCLRGRHRLERVVARVDARERRPSEADGLGGARVLGVERGAASYEADGIVADEAGEVAAVDNSAGVAIVDLVGRLEASRIDTTTIGDYDEPRRRVRLRAAASKTRRALWVDLPDVLA